MERFKVLASGLVTEELCGWVFLRGSEDEAP